MTWEGLHAAFQSLLVQRGPALWLEALAVTALALALGELLRRGLFRALRALASRTSTTYDDHLIERVRAPSRLLLLAGAAHLGAWVADWAAAMAAMAVVEWLLLTFLVVESVETLLVDLVLEERLQIRVPPLLRQVAIGVVYVGAALAVLGHLFSIDVTPLLATTSVVSLVLGLALQQPLSNLFSGLILHVDRPFREGDWLMVNGREGQVLQIGWRSTRLRTFSGDEVVLPNNTLIGVELQNFSAPSRATARTLAFPLPPSVAPEQIEAWAVEALASVEGVVMEPAPQVWLIAIEPTFVRYQIKFWVEDFSRHDPIESDVLKALWRRLRREGLPPAIPTPLSLEKL